METFKKEFKDILVSVQAVDKTGKVLTIPSSKIKFGYRKNDLDKNLIRSVESDNRVADPVKAQKILKWKPKFSFEDLVGDMVESDLELITNNL